MWIRLAKVSDAGAIRSIYAPYVASTAISFEYEVPTGEEFRRRIAETEKKYPYFVAVDGGRVVGYAYASPFHGRIAYQHAVEPSVYVRRDERGHGVGRRLYAVLEDALLRQNVYKMYACVITTERERDGNLTDGSVRFHEKMGFHPVGRHEHCGYKFGKWYTAVWLEKNLAPLPEKPAPFRPYPEV